MKKFASLVLALAMVFSLSVSALADEYKIGGDAGTSVETGTTGINNVTIDVDPFGAADKIYAVTVKWDSLTFAYDRGTQGRWVPGSHDYTDGESAGWTNKVLNFSVYNHSNDAIVYTAEVVDVDDQSDNVTVNVGGNYTGTLNEPTPGTPIIALLKAGSP